MIQTVKSMEALNHILIDKMCSAHKKYPDNVTLLCYTATCVGRMMTWKTSRAIHAIDDFEAAEYAKSWRGKLSRFIKYWDRLA